MPSSSHNPGDVFDVGEVVSVTYLFFSGSVTAECVFTVSVGKYFKFVYDSKLNKLNFDKCKAAILLIRA